MAAQTTTDIPENLAPGRQVAEEAARSRPSALSVTRPAARPW